MKKRRSFNYTEAKDDNFSALPVGQYDVIIIDDKETGHVSRKQGKTDEYIKMTLMVVAPPEFAGRLVWHNQSLGDKSLFRLAQLYQAVEPDEAERNEDIDLNDDNEIHGEFFYKAFRISVIHETYNGKQQARPESFMPIEDEDEYNYAFDSANELVKSGKAGTGPRDYDRPDTLAEKEPVVSQELVTDSPEDDEDIPF